MRQRGDAWELRVFLGVDAVTGKQRYSSRTAHGGKRDAQRQLAEFVAEASRGLHTAPMSATVGELLEAWLDLASRDFSPKTTKETRGYVDRHLMPNLGDVPLSKLKASAIDRLYRQLQANGGTGGRSPPASRIRRR